MTCAPFLPIPPAVTHGPVKLLSSRLRTWRCENCTRLSGRVPDRRFPWVYIEDREPQGIQGSACSLLYERERDWISYNLSQPFSPEPYTLRVGSPCNPHWHLSLT